MKRPEQVEGTEISELGLGIDSLAFATSRMACPGVCTGATLLHYFADICDCSSRV